MMRSRLAACLAALLLAGCADAGGPPTVRAGDRDTCFDEVRVEPIEQAGRPGRRDP
ncbi:MAG: hypothetical protein ACLF0G_02715 [Candidatus Brocadiia bacterium]